MLQVSKWQLSGPVQDMLFSLQRPISILGEVTTVNMSFHASYQSKDGQSILGGLENFPLTYNAVPGYCGWPNSVLSPVAQFDLTYLASATELQLTSGLYTNTDLLMNMMDNQDDTPIAGLYHLSAGPFSPGTGKDSKKVCFMPSHSDESRQLMCVGRIHHNFGQNIPQILPVVKISAWCPPQAVVKMTQACC